MKNLNITIKVPGDSLQFILYNLIQHCKTFKVPCMYSVKDDVIDFTVLGHEDDNGFAQGLILMLGTLLLFEEKCTINTKWTETDNARKH